MKNKEEYLKSETSLLDHGLIEAESAEFNPIDWRKSPYIKVLSRVIFIIKVATIAIGSFLMMLPFGLPSLAYVAASTLVTSVLLWLILWDGKGFWSKQQDGEEAQLERQSGDIE